MATYQILDFDERDESWWDTQECAHLYYSYPWLLTLTKTYRFDAKIIIDAEDQLKTVFCPVNDVRGSRIIILPFSDYTPSDGMTVESYNGILSFLKEKYPQSTIVLKTTLDFDNGIEAKISSKALHYNIPLHAKEPDLPTESFKMAAKKARDNGLKVKTTKNGAAISTFYNLYHHIQFERYKRIPQPLSFFEHLWLNFIKKGRGMLIEAADKNKVVASMIALSHNDTLYYKYGSCLEQYLDENTTALMFNKLIHRAKKKGMQQIDLGICDLSEESACRRDWYADMGADPSPVKYWTYTPDGTDAETEEKVLKNLHKLTDAMIKSNLNPAQTSRFSEKIYPLFA